MSGHVTAAGQPLAGAFVAATGPSGHAATVTGGDGSFSLSLPDGTYQIAANAPGYAATVDDGASVSGAVRQDLSLQASGATVTPVPVFGRGSIVAADGTPGVFYLAGTNVGTLYRTLDWGGTWTQVTVAPDDPANGLSEAAFPTDLTTSGYPGEVAVTIAGAGVFYSTNYGVTWHLLGDSAPPTATNAGSGAVWAHAGTRSVLLLAWNSTMYEADMNAANPTLEPMTRPYAPVGEVGQPYTVADGAGQPWLATVNSAGTVSIYPLIASTTAPAPAVTIPGFTGDAFAIGLGGQSATGEPPSGVVVSTQYLASMSVKAPTAGSYPPPASASIAAVCGGPTPGFLPVISNVVSVTPNTGGAYGAAWSEECWLQDVEGNLISSGGYGNGVAIDAGYDATNSSPGNDAVLLVAPQPSSLASYLSPLGVVKLAASSAGFPVALTNQAATAAPGTDPASAGVAVTGITAGTVQQTTFGPAGSGQVASATDIGGAASGDGGSSFTRATFAEASSVAWWQGASGTWLLFGQSAYAGDPDLIAGFENWTSSTPAVVGGNVTGSTASNFGLVGEPPGGQPGIDAIAGVPGQDVAFIGAGFDDADEDSYDTPAPIVSRVNITSGPAFSNMTPIGAGVITKPGPLAYCPASGSASSLQDVLLVVAEDESGGAIYRVTGATGPSPTVTQIAELPPTDLGVGLAALKADCATGTVIAASGAAGTGLVESADGGQTFTEIPVTDPGGAPATIRALALSPGGPPSILVGDAAGFIQSSSDGGQTWTVVNDPATGVNLASTANNDGGIEDIEATPAASGVASSAHGTTRIRRLTASSSATDLVAGDLVAGPGEYILTHNGKPTSPIPSVFTFKLTNTRFVLARGPTAVVAGDTGDRKHRPQPKRGTTFLYSLSVASTSAILFSRESHGRLVGGKCVAAYKSTRSKRRCTTEHLVELPSLGRRVGGKCVARTARNTHAKRCRIYTPAAIVRDSHAGMNRIPFTGRIGRTSLAPGTYVAILLARIGNGPDSQPRTASFTIVGG